ncbi:hypothetical protein KZP23_16645 [Echinicola marina]|uniref:hypothetical protein n=1 Tax=Echinicola marina TaxID=2859768 RepID=UPI001CF6D121|nr:hypothetical protein [Echinicola marina]UCS92319.1 hypothetical protein KZP23_16645 [Echinicola marina]
MDRIGNKKKHAKEIFELTGHVQYLGISIKEIRSKFESTQASYKNWQLRWNEEIWHLNKFVLEYIIQYQDNMGSLVEEIIEIKSKFSGNDGINRETQKLISHYILPIERIIQSHLSFDKKDQFLIQIITITQRLQILGEEKWYLTSSTIKILTHYIDTINHTLKSAEQNVSYLSKSAIRTYFDFK